MTREMKDSGIEWIGEVPKEWKVGKVKVAFNRKNEKAEQENPIILSLARSGIKMRDITTNEGQIAESYYNYNPVEKGDLLVNPMDLYSGANCNVSEIEGVISPAYVNLRAKKGFVAKYYDYYFKLQYWGMAFFAHGKGVSFDNRWTLSNETLMNYFIPMPSLEKQVEIVNYLETIFKQIDTIIQKQTQLIEEYKTYKQSLITETVTKGLNPNVEMKDSGVEWIKMVPKDWQSTRIKKVFSFGKGLPITKDNLTDSGIGVISYGQIHSKENNGIQVKECLVRYVDESYLQSNSSSLVNMGDFIFADTSEDLDGCGNSIYVDINEDEQLFAGYHTIILKSLMNYSSKYYAYLFKTDAWRSQIRSRVSGIKLFSITQRILKEVTVVVPPEQEQREIVNYLDKKSLIIDKAIDEKQSLIQQLEAYKKSLIYECVTGKQEIPLTYEVETALEQVAATEEQG